MKNKLNYPIIIFAIIGFTTMLFGIVNYYMRSHLSEMFFIVMFGICFLLQSFEFMDEATDEKFSTYIN